MQRIAIGAAAFLLLCILVSSGAEAAQNLPVAAAADLAKLFDSRIIPAFKKQTGIEVQATFAATGLLQQQMENGAPYQVFISADVVTPQKLAQENILDPSSVEVYAVGQLVLWSRSMPVSKLALTSALEGSNVKAIAIANPKIAPYGAASIQTLTTLHILNQVRSKIVYSENILQALQFGRSGNADLAFTALSLVKGRRGGSYSVVPAADHAPIAQAVGVVWNAEPAARRFEAFLLSKPIQRVFRSAGFLPPPR